ncbi:hypothetical protein BLNAU_6688 [Blattamonas nauphoetae]|uniref:Uncharacterized protein n=1 Tax=Blattamonas nauphoetae TaxID=2049346 RepID=A0ABQ9Y3Z4_9EUKA|nr:hypothetical protein BLNAU_6688 [Blattamonas nauphoetae]
MTATTSSFLPQSSIYPQSRSKVAFDPHRTTSKLMTIALIVVIVFESRRSSNLEFCGLYFASIQRVFISNCELCLAACATQNLRSAVCNTQNLRFNDIEAVVLLFDKLTCPGRGADPALR